MSDIDTDAVRRMVSTKQVAELFGVTPPTIREWIAQGKLEARQMNGRWRVYYDSVVDLMNEEYGS